MCVIYLYMHIFDLFGIFHIFTNTHTEFEWTIYCSWVFEFVGDGFVFFWDSSADETGNGETLTMFFFLTQEKAGLPSRPKRIAWSVWRLEGLVISPRKLPFTKLLTLNTPDLRFYNPNHCFKRQAPYLQPCPVNSNWRPYKVVSLPLRFCWKPLLVS